MGVFPFVDSHAHLTDSAFDADRAAVIERARANGCRAIVCIGESLAAADKAMALAATQPGFLFPTAGVHPHEAESFDAARDLDVLRSHFSNGAVAVGECGLDYHYDNAPRDVQRAVFGTQIELAREVSRPLVVHSREAEADTIACIAEAQSGGVIGVLHCFTGGPALAEAALAAGWYVSFAGVVTFKKWDADTLIRMVPDNRLLAETDSPYLTPAPFRGQRNEPSRVALIVQRLAEVRGQMPAATGALVTENARRCFGLALGADAA